MIHDSEWRYYRLAQMEHASPGSHLGHWRLMADMYASAATGEEITEWATNDVRFYRTDDAHVITARVRADLGITGAAERIAERLGTVEVA